MSARKLLRWSGLSSVVFSVLACSLLVDTSEIVAGCGAGMKYCDDKCVHVDDAFYGCSATACAACPVLGDYTEVRCIDGACARTSCVYGWGCDGCSISLYTDAKNCGFCNHRCETAPEEEMCREGVCVLPEGMGGAGGASGAGGEAGTSER